MLRRKKQEKPAMAPSEFNDIARAVMASGSRTSLAERIKATVADAEAFVNKCAEDDYRATQRQVPLDNIRMMLTRGQHPCLVALRLIEERGE